MTHQLGSFKVLTVIPHMAQTRTLRRFHLLSNQHPHTGTQTSRPIPQRPTYTRQLAFLQTHHPFWHFVHAVLSTQINSNPSSKTLLKCHFSFPPDLITLVTLNCNCLLTCVTILELELKDNNLVLFTCIPLIPIIEIQIFNSHMSVDYIISQ